VKLTTRKLESWGYPPVKTHDPSLSRFGMIPSDVTKTFFQDQDSGCQDQDQDQDFQFFQDQDQDQDFLAKTKARLFISRPRPRPRLLSEH